MKGISTITDDIFKGKDILLVDDDTRNTFALTSYLEQFGLIIYSAENGIRAIELLADHPGIKMILMDMMMPEMDGFETMEKIKGKKETSHIPIIAVTAKAMKGDREKCLNAGAAEYVSKPVHMDDLMGKMKILLSGS